MQLRTFLSDDRAVSPVIGVILMVAITVILAAVIGTFVLGLGDQVDNTAPQASFSFSYESGTDVGGCDFSTGSYDGALTVTHDGGDKIMATNLNVGQEAWDSTDCGGSTEVTAGSSIQGDVDTSDTVRVTWSKGDSSATLGKWTGPDA